MLREGWIGYRFSDSHRLQIGLTTVPFGILPYTGNNYFFNLNYYAGLEDDADMGINTSSIKIAGNCRSPISRMPIFPGLAATQNCPPAVMPMTSPDVTRRRIRAISGWYIIRKLVETAARRFGTGGWAI